MGSSAGSQRDKGVNVLIQNTWQGRVTKSELVHERLSVCVGTFVSAHVWFSIFLENGQMYLWKCVRGDGSRLYWTIGKDFVGGAIFLTPWKTAPCWTIFPWRQQNWVTPIWQPVSSLATTCAPRALSLLMSSCNRPHIRTTARADRSCLTQHKFFVMNKLTKTNSLTSPSVIHAGTKTDSNFYCLGRMIFTPNQSQNSICLCHDFYLS